MRLSLVLLCAGSLLGCEGLQQRLCERQGTCDADGGPNDLAFRVLTPRLPRTAGGTLTLSSDSFMVGAPVGLELVQGATRVPVTLPPGALTAGGLSVALDAALLAKLRTGLVEVVATLGVRSGRGRLSLYTPPSLRAEAALPFPAGSVTPLGLGVTEGGAILTWESYRDGNDEERRRVAEYGYDPAGQRLQVQNQVPVLQGGMLNYAKGALAALGRAEVLVLAPRSGMTELALRRCPLAMTACQDPQPSGVSAAAVLAVDAAGTLLASAGTPPLKAFALPSLKAVDLAATGGAVKQLAVADLSGDGVADVLAVSDGTAQVLLGRAGGLAADAELTSEVGARLREAGALAALALADVDGDGLPDLALSTAAQPRDIQVAYNLGGGKLDKLQKLVSAGGAVSALAGGDTNADGNADLAYVSESDRRLGLFLNTP